MSRHNFTVVELAQAAEAFKRFLAQNRLDPNGSYPIDYLVQNLTKVLQSEYGLPASAPPTAPLPPQDDSTPTTLPTEPGNALGSDEVIIKKINVHQLFRRPGGQELLLTNQHVILRGGALGKSELAIALNTIQDVTAHYDFKGRVAGYGTIRIVASGSGATEIVAENMVDPEGMKNAILKQMYSG